MTKHVHGGDVYQHNDCIDFSANCNPLGTPKGVIDAGIKSLQQVFQYPQVGYLPLREAIGAYEGVSAKNVICGNGAAELIFTLTRAMKPKKALLLAPTFAEYEQALRSEDCEIQYYYLKQSHGFAMQTDFFAHLNSELDMVFLCNPNNPTGILTERAFLQKVLELCAEKQIFLVVDECFQDFIEEPENYTLKQELSKYSNLFLLKAFTKRYAMAGIRLGYGLCSNHKLLEKMESNVQPWNISTIAQNCGIAALKETEYVSQGRQLIFQERAYLKEEMTCLGLNVFDSKANYIFFCGSEYLFEKCLEKKILIRNCNNYEGLSSGYYRIAVKTHKENEAFIQVLQEILR